MTTRLIQFLLMITIGLTPMLDAFAGVLSEDSAQHAANSDSTISTSDLNARQIASGERTEAGCCVNNSREQCNEEAECCNHCYSTLISWPFNISADSQPIFSALAFASSRIHETQPLIRPPRN